jgi:hypothetical protein
VIYAFRPPSAYSPAKEKGVDEPESGDGGSIAASSGGGKGFDFCGEDFGGESGEVYAAGFVGFCYDIWFGFVCVLSLYFLLLTGNI